MTTDLIPVCVGACLCPGTPHADGDFVHLRPKLGLAAGIAVQRLIVQSGRSRGRLAADLTGVLAEAYLLYGVEEWNLLDSLGKPIPVTEDSISEHLLADYARGEAAADKADDLYMLAVLAPLLNAASKSLRSTPTNGSTSPQSNGGLKRPKRSKPSSTTTSPTDDTSPTT